MPRTDEFLLEGRRVNRFDLYELCVQEPEVLVRFLSALHPGDPEVLGEDFSGPGGVARAWVGSTPTRRAILTDLDAEPLGHAYERAREQLGSGGMQRFAFQHDDAAGAGGRCDVVAALNFAVCELHQRRRLLSYLRNVLFRLEAGGVFAADLYGGRDAMAVGAVDQVVSTADGDVVYTWEQRAADPATGRVETAMHFTLPGGRTVRDAFVYDWRLWTTPELRDAMREAGFRSTEVHDRYGDAVDDEGALLPRPISRDDANGGAEADAPAPDEPYVHYVVGRV